MTTTADLQEQIERELLTCLKRTNETVTLANLTPAINMYRHAADTVYLPKILDLFREFMGKVGALAMTAESPRAVRASVMQVAVKYSRKIMDAPSSDANFPSVILNRLLAGAEQVNQYRVVRRGVYLGWKNRPEVVLDIVDLATGDTARVLNPLGKSITTKFTNVHFNSRIPSPYDAKMNRKPSHVKYNALRHRIG